MRGASTATAATSQDAAIKGMQVEG
eukprot:COSAG01_NODE_16167_length_1263_cov_1.685567_1_plen_24_part_10